MHLVKLSDLHDSAGAPTQSVLRERLDHLTAIEACTSSTSSEFDSWADTRLDRWLVDWALRHGKERTARQIACEKGIEVGLSMNSDSTGSTSQ
jgi:macrophage erythroblast attacher